MKKPLILSILILFISLFFGLYFAQAATLYFEPQKISYENNQEFILTARINLQGTEIINFVEGYIAFPSDVLMVKDVSFGESILSVIPHQPIIDNQRGLISFAGGIPNGYSGKITGDPGPSNLLLKIIFKSKKISLSNQINFLANSQVLLNDGLATPTQLTLQPAIIDILSPSTAKPINQWAQELIQDTIKPESFIVELRQDPLMFDNKWFIIFSTIDKQSGIDYFMVREGNYGWEKAESPYVLKDQSLKEIIQVKAVDKAGNERIELPKQAHGLSIIYYIIIIIALIILAIIIVKIKNRLNSASLKIADK